MADVVELHFLLVVFQEEGLREEGARGVVDRGRLDHLAVVNHVLGVARKVVLSEGERMRISPGSAGDGLAGCGLFGVDLEGEEVGALVPDVDVAEGLEVDDELLQCSEVHIQNAYRPVIIGVEA